MDKIGGYSVSPYELQIHLPIIMLKILCAKELMCGNNAPINVKPHLPPLGQWMGEGGALAQIWLRETAPWVGLLTRAYLERFRHCA